MKKSKAMLKKAVEAVAIKSAKTACGAASYNHFGQPKEPKNLKQILKQSK